MAVVAVLKRNTWGTSENSGICKRGALMKSKTLAFTILLIVTAVLLIPAIAPDAALADTTPAPTVSSVSPNSGVSGLFVSATLTGTGFQAGASVKLEGINWAGAMSVTIVSDKQIDCLLALGFVVPASGWFSLPLGKYDVVVTNPDGQAGRLTGGFTVTNICGQGAGTMVVGFGLMMGLLSLGGSGLLRRRRGRKYR
jgi:hypothetical protein